MKPNLFDIGPKELNQDAFLAWLMLYADDSNVESYNADDLIINKCAKHFITTLLQYTHPGVNPKFYKVEAGRQWDKIDIWATIDDKYCIIIEDKTYTGQHSDQLRSYRKVAEDWCKTTNGYLQPVCVYLKTGDECLSSLKNVESAGFHVFTRRHLLECLSPYAHIKNNIFQDFYQRLVRLETSIKQYGVKHVDQWHAPDWIGLYHFFDSSIELVNWYYLNNKDGGFWNLILDWPTWNGFPVHYQIEAGRIAFKISFDPKELDREGMEFDAAIEQARWHNHLLRQARIHFPEIKRPRIYRRTGVWRTVAVIDRNDWLITKNGIIDKSSTVAFLSRLKSFMTECVSRDEQSTNT